MCHRSWSKSTIVDSIQYSALRKGISISGLYSSHRCVEKLVQDVDDGFRIGNNDVLKSGASSGVPIFINCAHDKCQLIDKKGSLVHR